MTKLCSIEGCSRPHSARGLCARHYQQQYARGTAAASSPSPPPAQQPAEKTPALPVLDYPIFSPCDSPSAEEGTFKKELYASTIKLYEESIAARRQACLERLEKEGPATVLAESAAIDADERRLREYRWALDTLMWMEGLADPAIKSLPVLEQLEKHPIPKREAYGLPSPAAA